MQTQFNFDAPAVNSATSIEAAAHIDSINGGKREMQLLNVMQLRGDYGITHHEAQVAFKWSGDYERPAMNSLMKNGLVKKTIRTRPNDRGKQCEVWIVTERGKQIEL
jgi:hypothetical protein